VPKTLRALGIVFFRLFRVIASESVPTWWGLCGHCRLPYLRLRRGKDIPKVVSDGEINPKKRTKSNWLLQPLRQNKRHVVGENPVKINKIPSRLHDFERNNIFLRTYPDKVRIVQKFGHKRVTDSDDDI
jgi:hypothetical protein